MVLLKKATNGIATRAEGAFTNCVPGSDVYELSYSCQGPACSSLNVDFQNIVCHKDGSSTLICSNNIKCQPGTSSYQSNFTFSQNEPDPWSPVMENESDAWVHQDQHVLLGSCAKFSLISDGTKEGTRVDDEGQAGVCPNLKGLSMSAVDSGFAGATRSTGQLHAHATSRPLVLTGRGSQHNTSKSLLLLAFFFTSILLLPGSQASGVYPRLVTPPLQSQIVRARAVSDNIRGFAEGFVAELAQKANVQSTNGEAFAHNLVADVVSSICQDHFNSASLSTFTPEIVKDCVASIYGSDRLLQPATQFLAIFFASLLCDYIASEAYPNGQKFLPDRCEGLQDLAKKVPAGDSAASLSVSNAPSSPGTGIASVGALSTIASYSNVQALSRLSSAPSQAGVPQSDTVLMGTVGPYALSASESLSASQETSSRLSTDKTIATAPFASTLLSDAVLPVSLSNLATPSTQILPLPSQTSSPKLSSSETSLSGAVPSQLLLSTPLQIGTSITGMSLSRPLVSGVNDIDPVVSRSVVVASQATLSTALSAPAQTISEIDPSSKQRDGISIESVNSNAASASRLSLGSLRFTSSSIVSFTKPEPKASTMSQDSALATALPLQTSRIEGSPPSSSFTSMVSSLGTVPPSTSTTNIPTTEVLLTDAPALVTNSASVSFPVRLSTNAMRSDFLLSSKPTLSLVASELESSFRTESDVGSASLKSAMTVPFTASEMITFDNSIPSSSPDSVVSSSIPSSSMPSEPSLTGSLTPDLSSVYAPSSSIANSVSLSKVKDSSLTTASYSRAASATSSYPNGSSQLPSGNHGTQESGTSINNSNTSEFSALNDASSANSRLYVSYSVSSSTLTTSETSGSSPEVSFAQGTSNRVPVSGIRSPNSNLVATNAAETTDPGTSSSPEAVSSFNFYLNELSSASPNNLLVNTRSEERSTFNSNASRLQTSVEVVETMTATANTISSTTPFSESLSPSVAEPKPSTSEPPSFLSTTSNTQQANLPVSTDSNPPTLALSPTTLLTTPGTDPATSVMSSTKTGVSEDTTSVSVRVGLASMLSSAGSSYQIYEEGPSSSISTRTVFSSNRRFPTGSVSVEGTVNAPEATGLNDLARTNSSASAEDVPAPNGASAFTSSSSTASQASGLIDPIVISPPMSALASPMTPTKLGEPSSSSEITIKPTVGISAPVSVKHSRTSTGTASVLINNTRFITSDARSSQGTFSSLLPILGNAFNTSVISTMQDIASNKSRIPASDFPSTSTNEGPTQLPELSDSSFHASQTSIQSNMSSARATSLASQVSPALPSTVASSRLSSAAVSLKSFGRSFSSPYNGLLPTTANHSPSVSSTAAISVVSISVSTSITLSPSESPVPNLACVRNTTKPDFCSGSGCVSLEADAAHCGACNQTCEHVCHLGACMCPDLTKPDTNNKCGEKPSEGMCVDGYTRNVFQICRPAVAATTAQTSIQDISFKPKTTQSLSKPQSSVAISSTSAILTETLECPPGLPDICNEGCFNTKSEHNHCGGCGRYCSGTCIDGSCFATSTQLAMQPIPTKQIVTTSSSRLASSIHPSPASTTELVAAAIVKGLAGPGQAEEA